METKRKLILFSRCLPWSSLGLAGRVARVCRTIFGSVLFVALLLIIVLAVWSLQYRTSVWQVVDAIWIIPFIAFLAWSVGCIFIWRGVETTRKRPYWGGSRPPEPPAEGAPRPAPLKPFSPISDSAHCPLPDERGPGARR